MARSVSSSTKTFPCLVPVPTTNGGACEAGAGGKPAHHLVPCAFLSDRVRPKTGISSLELSAHLGVNDDKQPGCLHKKIQRAMSGGKTRLRAAGKDFQDWMRPILSGETAGRKAGPVDAGTTSPCNARYSEILANASAVRAGLNPASQHQL